MKVLVVGNSQSGALKRSYDQNKKALNARGLTFSFFVIPGIQGPDLEVVEDRFVIGCVSKTHPPYASHSRHHDTVNI